MIQDIYPHKLDNVFRPGTEPGPDAVVFHYVQNGFLLKEKGQEISFPLVKELPDQDSAKLRYLFTMDGTDCFWYMTDKKQELPGYEYENLRSLRKRNCEPKHLFFAAYTAQQLISWYQDNIFCGRCGTLTEHSKTERALVCPSCHRTIYPRIIPAVIVGVTDGERIVLTKYAGRDVPYFALIAGFTEIGETLEETVAREVMEEVGLKVKNIRYYKSQPWAMADDILMGFYCDVDGDTTIRLDRNELKEGGWYTPDEVILQPDDYSLTNEMMKRFKDGIKV